MEGKGRKEITKHTMPFTNYYFFFIYCQIIQQNGTYTHIYACTFSAILLPNNLLKVAEVTKHMHR